MGVLSHVLWQNQLLVGTGATCSSDSSFDDADHVTWSSFVDQQPSNYQTNLHSARQGTSARRMRKGRTVSTSFTPPFPDMPNVLTSEEDLDRIVKEMGDRIKRNERKSRLLDRARAMARGMNLEELMDGTKNPICSPFFGDPPSSENRKVSPTPTSKQDALPDPRATKGPGKSGARKSTKEWFGWFDWYIKTRFGCIAAMKDGWKKLYGTPEGFKNQDLADKFKLWLEKTNNGIQSQKALMFSILESADSSKSPENTKLAETIMTKMMLADDAAIAGQEDMADIRRMAQQWGLCEEGARQHRAEQLPTTRPPNGGKYCPADKNCPENDTDCDCKYGDLKAPHCFCPKDEEDTYCIKYQAAFQHLLKNKSSELPIKMGSLQKAKEKWQSWGKSNDFFEIYL